VLPQRTALSLFFLLVPILVTLTWWLMSGMSLGMRAFIPVHSLLSLILRVGCGGVFPTVRSLTLMRLLLLFLQLMSYAGLVAFWSIRTLLSCGVLLACLGLVF
jgi:hypothetical protein